jgi:hypothetical protein
MPVEKIKPVEKLRKLENLADLPKEQFAYALQLLQTEKDREVLAAALAVLKELPNLAARPVLLERYQYYAEDGPKRDAGTYLRTAVLRALRPIARHEDLPLVEKACLTYEVMPSRHDAEGGLLRSVALTILNDLDEAIAGYYAVKLLVDKVTSEMSGEPALTAAKVLADQGQILPLYEYVLQENIIYPEVAATCLRSLQRVPKAVLAGIVTRYRQHSSEALLLGLFDLLLAHPDGPEYSTVLTEFLTTTSSFEMYRYLLMALITSSKPKFVGALFTASVNEKDPLKRQILLELLPLVKGYESEVADLLKKLQVKKAGRAGNS